MREGETADYKLPGVDVRVGVVRLASGPVWTVLAMYTDSDEAARAAVMLSKQTKPRKRKP